MTETQSKTAHPKGLWVLFGTEMWERFNFYGMRAILTLFMVNALMLGESNASIIYGGFLALCYLTPLLGGFIADKYLGNRNCIILGGTLMAIGQFSLFYSATIYDSNLDFSKVVFWLGLFVIIFGNGFFKPNISSMVGSLYPPQEKTRLDSAFTIFYMGINIGALLSQYFVPLFSDVKVNGVQDPSVFKWGYLMACIAMVLGTIIFIFLKDKYVVSPDGNPIGNKPNKNNDAGEVLDQAKFTGKSVALVTCLFFILFFIFRYLLVGEFGFTNFEIGTLVKGIIYPIIYGAGISLASLILLDSTLTKVETQRILVIYIISFFIIFFWAAFEQAGSSLTFIASNQTDRNIMFGWEMPASMVQIFNGICIVLLAVPFSILWDKLRSKDREPISPAKQALGLAIISLSYFIIAHNVKDIGNTGLLAIKWLILLYFIQSCAELCLSPIGLSLVGKLAPRRFASLLYGVFFISNAAGYALAGTLGALIPATGDKFNKAKELGIDLQAILDRTVTPTLEQLKLLADNQISDHYPVFAGFVIHNLYEFFMVFVVLTGIAAIVLFALTPFLKKMMHGVR
jgi:POT family proton-dependent oligopeptide transporter